MPAARRCSPSCKLFRCGKHSLVRRGRELFYCGWIEGTCQAHACTFASCVKGKMLPDGTCGLSIKARPISEEIPAEELEVKFRSKTLRKLREEEFF